jgi:hypothetical protein
LAKGEGKFEEELMKLRVDVKDWERKSSKAYEFEKQLKESQMRYTMM